jgi:hypothetical protein
MKIFKKILKYVIFGIATIIIVGVLLSSSGCDNLKCRPDARSGYFGLICGGEF